MALEYSQCENEDNCNLGISREHLSLNVYKKIGAYSKNETRKWEGKKSQKKEGAIRKLKAN